MWIKTLVLRKLSLLSTNNPQFIIKSVLNVYYDCIQKLISDPEKILFNKKVIKVSKFLPSNNSAQLAKHSNIVYENYNFHFADVPIIPGLDTVANYNISVRDVYYTVCCFDKFPLAKPPVHETTAEEITDFFITKLIPFVARSDEAFYTAADSLLKAFMIIFGGKTPLVMNQKREFGVYDKSHTEGVKKLIHDESRILKNTKFGHAQSNLLSNLFGTPSDVLEVKELKPPSMFEPKLSTAETKEMNGTLTSPSTGEAFSSTLDQIFNTPQTQTGKLDSNTQLVDISSADEKSDSDESSSSNLERISDSDEESSTSLLDSNRKSKGTDVRIKDESDKQPINQSMLESDELGSDELELEELELESDEENSFHDSTIGANHKKRKRSDNKSKKIKKSKIMEILKLNKLDFVTSVDNSVFSEESDESGMDSLVLKVVRQKQTDSGNTSGLQSSRSYQSFENGGSSSESELENELDLPVLSHHKPNNTSLKTMKINKPSPSSSNSDFDPVSESEIESDYMHINTPNPNSSTDKPTTTPKNFTKKSTGKHDVKVIDKPIQNITSRGENITQTSDNSTQTLKESRVHSSNNSNKKVNDQNHSENTQKNVSNDLKNTKEAIKIEQNNSTNEQEYQCGFALDKDATRPNPNITKRTLAGVALAFSDKKELTLTEIDEWIRSEVKYFGDLRASWTSSLEKTLNKADHFVVCKTNPNSQPIYRLNPDFEKKYMDIKEKLVFGPKRTRAPKDMDRPPFPYNVLIGSALLMKNVEAMTKLEVEQWIMDTFDYYRKNEKWKQNLSNGLNKRFERIVEPGTRRCSWRMKPEHRLEFSKSEEFKEIKRIWEKKNLQFSLARQNELDKIKDNSETMAEISEIWKRKMNSAAFKCDPPFHLEVMVGIAILLSRERKLKSTQVINWISNLFTFYNEARTGWQDSVKKMLNERVDVFERQQVDDDVYYCLNSRYVKGFIKMVREVEKSEDLYPKIGIQDLLLDEHLVVDKRTDKQKSNFTTLSDTRPTVNTTKSVESMNDDDKKMGIDQELDSEAFLSANDKLPNDISNVVRMKNNAHTVHSSSIEPLKNKRNKSSGGSDTIEIDNRYPDKHIVGISDSSLLNSCRDSESDSSADSPGSEDSPKQKRSVEPSQIKLLSRVPKSGSTSQHGSNHENEKQSASEPGKSLAIPITDSDRKRQLGDITRTPKKPQSLGKTENSLKPKKNLTTEVSSTQRRGSLSKKPTTPNVGGIATPNRNKTHSTPKGKVISKSATNSKTDKVLNLPETSHDNDSSAKEPSTPKVSNPSSTVTQKIMTHKAEKSSTKKKTTPKSIKSTKPASTVPKIKDNNKLPVIKVETTRSPTKISPISKKTNDKIAKLSATGKSNLLKTKLISRLNDVKQPQTTIETKNPPSVKQSYKPLKMFTDGISSDDFESSEELTSSEDSDSELSGNDSDKPISKFKK
jgi:hypothetical protein